MWLESYLTQRSQYVCIDGKTSQPRTLRFGVPQGSVLGPLIFTAYTQPLGQLLKMHDVRYHVYADDTQVYVSWDPKVQGDLQTKLSVLEQCIFEVQNWLISNKLCINDSKTPKRS